MNTEGGGMMAGEIRDGVEWKPWYVRLAQFEGRDPLLLADAALLPTEHVVSREPRYGLLRGHPASLPGCECGCSVEDLKHRWQEFARFDSLDEALVAFHAAEERLIAGEI